MPFRPLSSAAALLAGLLLAMPAGAATPADPRQDDRDAAALRRLAEQGNGNAALRLGNLLARNRVPAAKYGKAVDWYKKGCALGDLSACHNTGISYEYGRNGATQSDAEAADFYLQSAERAFLPSMFNLAILYADARITSPDSREGLKWMLVAQRAAAQCPDRPLCQSVLKDEKAYRARLENRLSPAEQRETRQLAEVWQPLR